MERTLYESLCRVFKNLENCNFIQMNGFGPQHGVTSDDLKAFNDYFELEPYRFVYGDWDILKFRKNGADLSNEDYTEMKKQIDKIIDDLQQQTVKQTPKKEVELKYEDYGWLSPDGKYYDSGWATHQDKAADLLMELEWTKDYLEARRSEYNLTAGDYLSKYKNFVLVDSPSQGIPYPRILEGKKLTKKQREFLYDFYMERNLVSLAYKYFNEED